MTETGRPDQEPAPGSQEEQQAPVKGRRSFLSIKRELTDDELKSPAVQKLLIDDLERLEGERGELVDYRERFYQADKRAAVLEERLKRSLSFEIISSACLVIGALLMGAVSSFWDKQPAGWICVLAGSALIIAGIWAKRARL